MDEPVIPPRDRMPVPSGLWRGVAFGLALSFALCVVLFAVARCAWQALP